MVEARRRPRRGHFELTIETAVTSVEPSGVLLYRGLDVAELATTRPFESVAEIVWGGRADTRWPTPPPVDPDPARGHRDQILQAVWTAAVTDAERESLSPSHFRDAGRRSIQAAAATLAVANGRPPEGRVAELVLGGLSPGRPEPACAHAVDAALGLLADHELATSTLAARAAASTGADPYAVMIAGLSRRRSGR